MRDEFINQMTELDFPPDMKNDLSNDVHTLMWIEHLMTTEKMTISEMFDDAGFCEFLHLQYGSKITFDEMLGN